MTESTEKADLDGADPVLEPRIATMRKKSTDRYKLVEPDKKALEKSWFVEQIEMFDGKWNKFEDSRGWTWVQEELKDK